MMKSVYALPLLVASSLCAASGASALETHNGSNLNGLAFNGLAFNGLAFNGLAFNGLAFNGQAREGVAVEGDVLRATSVILRDGAHVALK